MIPHLLRATRSNEEDEDDRKENLLDFFTELPEASAFVRDQLIHKKSVDETFIPRRCEFCFRAGLVHHVQPGGYCLYLVDSLAGWW